jgi:hypothetical protein
MPTTWERTALQQAADQVVVRSSLRISGIAATIFGALALLAGVAQPVDVLLAVVGGALALVGLWNLTNPSAMGLALTAGALIMVGLYNVGSGFLEAAAGAKPFVGWQVLGVWQVIWGIQGFGRFRRFQTAFSYQVSDEQRSRAKQMIGDLRKANPKTYPDVIDFTTGGMSPKMVRARLMQDMAVLLIAGGDDVRIVPREEFDVDAPEAREGKPAKATVRAGGQTWKAVLPVVSLQRFRTWKQSSMGLQRAA